MTKKPWITSRLSYAAVLAVVVEAAEVAAVRALIPRYETKIQRVLARVAERRVP